MHLLSYFNENMMKNGDLPYDRLSQWGHVKYGYDSRYYIQGDFTYDGTEQFKPGNRFKFFRQYLPLGWYPTKVS